LLFWGRTEEETHYGRKFTLTKDKLAHALAQTIENLWAAYKRGKCGCPQRYPQRRLARVRPDGSLHPRKPTTQEIASAAPIDRYSLPQLQLPIGHDEALAPHIAEGVVRSLGECGRNRWANRKAATIRRRS